MSTDLELEGLDEPIRANGINGSRGEYLFQPVTTQQLADIAMGKQRGAVPADEAKEGKANLDELNYRKEHKDEAHFGVKAGVDPTKLEETGWAVMFPAVAPGSPEEKEQAAIYEALQPLLAWRKEQATRNSEKYYKEYRGPLGYRSGETKQKYMARLGAGPGPADPERAPYYILMVGSPQVIPYHVQFQIDVQYAIGRIHFDTVEEYANYARSVVAVEKAWAKGEFGLARELAFVGVCNPDDKATQLSRQHLIAPLADITEGWKSALGLSVARYFDDRATKATMGQLLGGAQAPALLFTASHGMGFDKGDPRQIRHGGALLMQEWGGPVAGRGRPITEDLYFSGDDVRSDASLLGTIAFNFACYGAGTPELDEFAKQAHGQRLPIAERAFVAGLHQKMLGLPRGGALATIGHVERAWQFSFMWGTGKKGAQEPQLAAFESTLKTLMEGKPVGLALEYFNERYAELASDLVQQVEEEEYNPGTVSPYTLANMWTSSNDARDFVVVGDPAVRLPLAPQGGAARGREVLEIPGTAPAVATPAAAPATPTAVAGPVVAEPATAAPEQAAQSFGLFGGDKPKDKPAEGDPAAVAEKPSAIRAFVDKVIGTLSDAITDAMTLEVRTYVSTDARAAAAVDSKALAQTGDLRAFTRIRLDGDMDVIIPERDGAVDSTLWSLHVELVKQAQQNRAEMIKTVVSAISSLTGLKL